jgi:RNA-directed DNA polymerase
MVDGALISTEGGTPQGGPISLVLSNMYLHFTLDLWFEKKFKAQCQGEVYLVRFADDFVESFQFWGDAQNFQRRLRERFAQFNLELAEEKTRLLLFGCFTAVDRRKHGPETRDV